MVKKLTVEGLELIKKKHDLTNNRQVSNHIGVDYSTLWRALNVSAGGEFIAKTLRYCPELSYHELFFDDEIASL